MQVPVARRFGLPEKGREALDQMPCTVGMIQFSGLFDVAPAAFEFILARARVPERLEQPGRNTPVSHRAVGLGFDDLFENSPRFHVHHVVQHAEGIVEIILNGPAALTAGIYAAAHYVETRKVDQTCQHDGFSHEQNTKQPAH